MWYTFFQIRQSPRESIVLFLMTYCLLSPAIFQEGCTMIFDEASSVATSLEKTERTVDVRGIATHMFEAGSPGASPLLYLHGANLGNLWLAFHTKLAQQFHVFAPDTAGCGLTEGPNWMRDKSDYILYVRDLLDTVDLNKHFIVRISLVDFMHTVLSGWYVTDSGRLVIPK